MTVKQMVEALRFKDQEDLQRVKRAVVVLFMAAEPDSKAERFAYAVAEALEEGAREDA